MNNPTLVDERELPFPEEFRAWFDYLEISDPAAHALFAHEAHIDLR